jgi:hypothetical protein
VAPWRGSANHRHGWDRLKAMAQRVQLDRRGEAAGVTIVGGVTGTLAHRGDSRVQGNSSGTAFLGENLQQNRSHQ